MSWTTTFVEDPLDLTGRLDDQGARVVRSQVVWAKRSLAEWPWCQDHVSRVAVADYVARCLAEMSFNKSVGTRTIVVEMLDQTTIGVNTRRRKHSRQSNLTPFMLERTDVFCSPNRELNVFVRVMVYQDGEGDSPESDVGSCVDEALEFAFRPVDAPYMKDLMRHIAMAVLQDRIRRQLKDLNAVAFVANGSILPRRSGASLAPMESPPAVPFEAPQDSPMNQTIMVDMGGLSQYVEAPVINGSTSVSLTGLVVPRGISLIVGGGYHGKSTLLRCLAAGVYNKIPGDGREFCVTVDDAVTVRAEDGRYVNNCNVSAFISNLPTLPGMSKVLDTAHFSSGEASGSTSQAANVVEAIEMGASVFLVDEDVSAANFMARDGRMRSLVMDESITPLLYRVNGLYQAHGISSVVVVGGVGDWLDVPDNVILMDKYTCRDATKKAHSVSRQFSHGHVQYAGRGVVHRLDWHKSGTPIPRRPADDFARKYDPRSTSISLIEGGHGLVLHHSDTSIGDEEDYIDLSRVEQLMGRKPQLYGCGLAILSMLNLSLEHSSKGLKELLEMYDLQTDDCGFGPSVLAELGASDSWKLLVESLGHAYRPRRFEVGQALVRLRGIQLEELPLEDDGSEAAARAEEERKKRELLELWNSRRKK